MFVIGTAGHVDHGKSSLILALTGIDPDRLPEEKQRGMTIDLGFAWLKLPNGQEVGIVDVPGHERFIKNMIAGVGAIDGVIFVVAADDGWMPQSQEHLDILKLLRIKKGVIALTKVDLVIEDWLKLMEEDIKLKVKNSFLENSPIIKVSSTGNIGLEELKQALMEMFSEMEPPKDIDKPRLFIDRVFTMTGRGTIVTGTLALGNLTLGQEVEILPQKVTARIRNIQTHKKDLKFASPGSRVALNLSGIEKEKLSRGNVILNSNFGKVGTILQAQVEVLPDLKLPLKQGSQVQILLGTQEVLERVYILEKEKLEPGEIGLVELKAKEEMTAFVGDRFILRYPGPQITIGGGVVLDPEPLPNIKKEAKIQYLSKRINLQLPDLILSELEKRNCIQPSELLQNIHFSEQEIRNELEKLKSQNLIVTIPDGVVLSQKWKEIAQRIQNELQTEHRQHSYKLGLTLAELASRLKIEEKFSQELINFLLKAKQIAQRGAFLSLSDFNPQLSQSQRKVEQIIWDKFNSSPLTPPTKEELLKQNSEFETVLYFLLQQNQLIELTEGILFKTAEFEKIKSKVIDLMQQKGKVTVGEVKEHLATTRKYAVPILEKLDQLEITKRVGDYRILNSVA
ncbi:MAG: selenocysteine-specific elongation factor [candidate division Zixibacteria bacterium RBG-1]|nr:MAG: selenocysteine-specific elongation factor [candidate division Zixibacteria bacterium RBG-1]OGC85363.1 MAG: selenocysteine-specific translation elongation factor [candidate division Zixibacteria bacterium RBG_19FT_COMBO_42_43]